MLDKKKPFVIIQMTPIDTVGELQELNLKNSLNQLPPPHTGSGKGRSYFEFHKRPNIPVSKTGLGSELVLKYWEAVQSKSQNQLSTSENIPNRIAAGFLPQKTITSDIVWSVGQDDDAFVQEIKDWTHKLDQYILRTNSDSQACNTSRLQFGQKPRMSIVENQKRNKSSFVHQVNKDTLIFTLAAETNLRHLANHHVLRFDSVGNKDSNYVQGALTRMSDELIMTGRHICHVRVTPHHQPNAQYMRRLLVGEVESRVEKLRGKVLEIRMKYTDVSKNSPMLPNYFADANKLRREETPPALVFKTSLGLVRWLQTHYGKHWAKADTHDCFDLQYVYDDAKGKIRTICFSVLDFHLSKMNSYEKDELRNFFEDIKEQNRAAKATVLNECMRQFLDDTRKWQMWFIFDVPIVQGVGVLESDEILSFANAAYDAFQNGTQAPKVTQVTQAPQETQVVEEESKIVKREQEKSVSVKNSADAISEDLKNLKDIKMELLNDIVMDHNQAEDVIQIQKFEAIMCKPPIAKLNWKETIDAQVSGVLKAMEAFNTKCRSQTNVICINLTNLISLKEDFIPFKKSNKETAPEFNYDVALNELYQTAVSMEASVPPQEVTDYLMDKIQMLRNRFMENKLEHHGNVEKMLMDMIVYNKMYMQDNGSINIDADINESESTNYMNTSGQIAEAFLFPSEQASRDT